MSDQQDTALYNLSAPQSGIVRDWAQDKRELWGNEEAREINLATFARAILHAASRLGTASGSCVGATAPPQMSMRDYFAGRVISQCQITVSREEPTPDAEVIRIFAERYARTAYVIADAMLVARVKEGR